MSSDQDDLSSITREILVPGGALIDLLSQALALRNLFESLAPLRVDPRRDIAMGQKRLGSGLAISPTLAAMCIREPLRTLAFIRGLAEAIGEAMRPDRPVRVLYAGCGPYALLAVPLMTQFSAAQVSFTLLDIHQDALDGAMRLIGTLGLGDRVADARCTDAACYRIPPNALPDVIVSETMAVCLRNESQVGIARNLLRQAPKARMVPRSVSVEVALLNRAREHLLVPSDHVGEIPRPQRDRVRLGSVFKLDADSIYGWQGCEGDRLPAGRVRIPNLVDSRYRPHLLTRIAVYGDNVLRDYDCSLTIPRSLPRCPPLVGGETLQFQYRLGSHPELVYEVLD